MHHVSAQGVDERMVTVHDYYDKIMRLCTITKGMIIVYPDTSKTKIERFKCSCFSTLYDCGHFVVSFN